MKIRLFVALLFLVCSFPFFSFSADYQVKYEGSIMVFPSKDSIPDLDMDLFEIDLRDIPNDFQSMANKIYRGYFTSPSSNARGPVVYLFLSSWNKGRNYAELAVAQSGSARNKGQIYGISCPQNDGEKKDFSCFQQYRGMRTGSRTLWRLSFKNGMPVLDCSDGWSVYNFEEVGILKLSK
jgi:hypothetical protein